jgi:flavin reductase (DIM6/NTAB) family NADH-FMN oxidoreductase RutF
MSLDQDEFRSVLGRFATGVTVVTVADVQGRDFGITVTAFSSLSLEPPLVLVCIDHDASILPALQSASHFVVSILAVHQEAIARRFAVLDAEQRFDGIGFTRGQSGAAVIEDVLASIECRVVQSVVSGDHTIFIGEAEAANVRQDSPLLYYRGGYSQLDR